MDLRCGRSQADTGGHIAITYEGDPMTVATVVTRLQIDKAVAYHGELCPGLATGIQIAALAVHEVGEHTQGHRVVAVAETDMCGVDAIQAITGCTVGNRNLLMLDYGKIGFQFFTDDKAIRISGHPAWNKEYQALRPRVFAGTATAEEAATFKRLHDSEVTRILSTPAEEMFTVQTIDGGRPVTSKVDAWQTCSECGEDVMESRTRHLEGRQLCIPCFHNATGKV